MMTKKDYKEFATILKRVRGSYYIDLESEPALRGALNALDDIEEEMMAYFEKDNPNFNPHRFMQAAKR